MELDFDFKAFLRRHPDLCWKTTAILIRCDQPDRNGNIYPREVMEREIARWRALHDEGDEPAIGRISHHAEMSLTNVAAVGRRLRLDGDEVKLDVALVSTPEGMKLEQFLKAGGKVGISPEGLGCTDMDGRITNYKFTGFTIALAPPDGS